MRNLIDKNSEIKDKIHDSSSIEVFDALTTLSQEDIDFIKEELETSPTPKETFYKYLNFYQYVFFEYMFLSYEENYGKNQVYKIYDNFLPKSLIKLASVKRDIFDVMKKIIEAEYHFSKEQEKDLSTLLKFSGLSKAYKKNVFEEIAKIVSSDSKYQDPENSKEINERLITKSFKNSPRQKIKEYLLFNGEQIVEDFFESDYEISEKINKEEIKKETNLESFNIRYYFKNGRFEISIYNPENLEFKVHKKNNDFEVYDDMEVNYKVDFDEDVYFEFNNSILKDFFSFEGCSGGIQLMLVNKKTEKCIYYKLLTGDSFIEKDGIRESVLSDVVSSDYILIFYGNNKFQSIQEEQEELKNINHSLPSRFRCYDFNFDNNKVLDLDEIYKIKIEKSSRSEKRVVFDERTQSFSFLNKKKMFYGDLYFHLESSEKVSKEHLSAEVNGNIADILEDGCFYIKGDDIVAKTGLTIIKIKVYFKNKIFKTYYALYGKNYTSSGLFFEDLIDESNLEIIDGFVDKNEIKIDSNKKYLTILISKGNITKKVQVQNNLPIIKVMYKNNKEKSFGINNYIFDPAAEEYEIWFPKKRGALVYNVNSNGNPESIKELSPNKKNYITKYNNQSNSKSLKNIFFRHEDFPLIKLFEKDNKVFYDSAKNEYSLYSILGDKLYKLTEIYSRNGATKIKNNFIFPEKGMFYTLKEKHNNKQNDFYLSFLSIKNTINAEPVKYTINNVKLKENCSFIPPKRFDELLSLLHQKNWCKKNCSKKIEIIRAKIFSKSEFIDELKSYHFNGNYEILSSNTDMINDFKNINLFNNYKYHIGNEFLEIFSKGSGFYYQPDKLLLFDIDDSLIKASSLKKINISYFKFLIEQINPVNNFTTSIISNKNLRPEYDHLKKIFNKFTKKSIQRSIIREILFIIDYLHRTEEEFEQNYYKAINLDNILCEYPELFEYFYIIGKLINKGAPYERPQSI